MHTDIHHDELREKVRSRYAAIATQPAGETSGECGCAPTCCGRDAYARQLGYTPADLAAAPEDANLSLGCGNPIAIASIRPGETVLDLGSGAGFDCFIAARQLAGTGRVIGVDMTPSMISRARLAAARGNHHTVEFRLGEIEALPVADNSIDLAISNCVLNLSPAKAQVFTELHRVLKPGGRIAISDVIARKPLPVEWRERFELLTGCVAGAATTAELEQWLASAGFTAIRITMNESSTKFIDSWFDDIPLGTYVVSAIIEAVKP